MIGRRKPKADPVTPEVRERVLRRDKRCFVSKLEPEHVCRDRWGWPHPPTDALYLTVDHVKAEPRMGVRAPSDEAHMVAMCWGANVGVPSKAMRQLERAYLSELYPAAWGRA